MKRMQNYSITITISCLRLLLLLFISNVCAQHRTLLSDIMYSDSAIHEKLQKTDSLIKVFQQKNIDSLPYLYNDYAYWLDKIQQTEKAIFYGKKAVDTIKNDVTFNQADLQLFTFDLGEYYSKDDKIHLGIDTYTQAVLIDNASDIASFLYYRLGNAHTALNDYYKAFDYYELSIGLFLKEKGNRSVLRNVCQNMTLVCFQIKTKESLEKGRKYGKMADSLAGFINTSADNRFGIKLNLALLHNEEENLDFDTALKYYNQAFDIAKQERDTIKIRRIYQGLGDLYNIIDQEKSIHFFEKAIELTKETDTLHLSGLYFGLGHTYSIKKEYPQSLDYRHKGLYYFTGNNFIDSESITNDFLLDFEGKIDLLFYLPQLAETYLNYFEANNDAALLEKSILYFKMSDYLIDLLKINSREFKSRLFWRELSTDIYSKAIRACYLSNSVEDAFYFMEKNKALLLLEDISKAKFKNAVQWDKETLKEEKAIHKKLILLNETIKKYSNTTTGIDSLKKERIDLEIALSEIQNRTSKSNFTIDPKIIPLKTVQKNLKENEVCIEYHISIDDGYGIYTNKENAYALFITRQDSYFFEIPQLPELKKEIFTLIDSFKNPFKKPEDSRTFNIRSNRVYHKLFPSQEIRNLIQGKKIALVPDSYLSLLPFETLSISDSTSSYLIRNSEIRYLYSNSFTENIRTANTRKLNFLGMAPGVFKDPTLSTLHYGATEVQNLDNYYNGIIFNGEKASKKNFLAGMESASILHLATHANAEGDKTPWIAFNDQKLRLEELYLTKNNASLVVLSGCNTSVGKQEIGEGVMSLARGFFYSGSQSVISSLWSIDDLSTAEIMNDFYENLHEGQTKSEALHNAKISYLDNHSLSEVSPHFWASLILLGENDTLTDSSSWILYISIFLVISAIYLLFRFKKRFKKASQLQ